MERTALAAAIVMVLAATDAWAGKKGGSYAIIEESVGGIELPELGGGEVKMPWVEFAKLLEALRDGGAKPASPPVAHTVQTAVYTCAVDEAGERAEVHAEFEVEVMAEGWVTVPLLRGQVAVDDFELRGAGGVSLVQSWGQIDAVVEGPRSFEVSMDLTREVESEHGMKVLRIEGPQAVSGRLSCTIRGADLSVKVEPGIIEKRTEKDGTVTVDASLIAGGSFGLKWWEEVAIPDAEKKDLPAKVYGEVHTLLRIGEGLIRGVTQVDYSILQAGVQELSILVPDDVSVTNVQGADLADWEVRQGEGGKVLTAFLAYEVQSAYTLTMTFDKSMGQTSAVVQAPRLRLLGVERETGTYGVEVLTNVEVELESMSGMARIDSSELASPVMWTAEHPILLGFKYLEHPFELVLDVKKHADVPLLVATVDVADFTTLLTDDGKVLTRVLLSMRNNMKQFLKVELPPDSEIWSTHVSDKPVKPGRDEQGRILVPLEKSSSGGGAMQGFPVEIVYLTQVEPLGNKGTGGLVLCSFDLPVTHLQWSLFLPDEYRFKKFDGNVDEWEGPFEPIAEAAPEEAYDVIDQEMLEPQVQTNVIQQNVIGGAAQTKEIAASIQSMTKGVLPVKLSVPEKGTLRRFIKLLVIDEAAEITFKYRLPCKYR